MTGQIDALKALQMALARPGYYTGAIDVFLARVPMPPSRLWQLNAVRSAT